MEKILALFDLLPGYIKFSCDLTAVGTALCMGWAAFFAAVATPLSALASLAALVYTVLRTIQLIRDWKKK